MDANFPGNPEFGFIEWIKTFENISKEINTISDLSDGIVLFEICVDIDPHWFRLIRSADVGENWVFKYNNLKKLYRLLLAYCEEVLLLPVSGMTEPDLNLIAKQNSHDEILKVCSLVLTVAVNCEKKNEYIGKIMTLSEENQGLLMVAIERTMNRLGAHDTLPTDNKNDMDVSNYSDQSSNEYSDSYLSDSPNPSQDKNKVIKQQAGFNVALQEELMLHVERNQSLKANLEKMALESEKWRRKFEEERQSKIELSKQLEDVIDSSSNSMGNTSSAKSNILVKAEIEALKADLDKSELQKNEFSNQLQEAILKLNKTNSELLAQKSMLSELDRLRDQEQEHKFLLEKLSKTENIVEKYRTKLEQSSDLKRKLTAIEQQLQKELAEKKDIENRYLASIQSKNDPQNTGNGFIDSLSKLESQLNLATMESAELKNKLVALEKENKKLTIEADYAQNSARDLEERVREMELSGVGMDSQTRSDNKNHGSELSEAFGESPTQLKREIQRLSSEVETLKNALKQSENNVKETELLESWLEDANKEKKEAIDRALAAENTIKDMRAQITTLQNGESKQLTALEQQISELVAKLEQTQEKSASNEKQSKSLFSELNKSTQQVELLEQQLNKVNMELHNKSNMLEELEKYKEAQKKTLEEIKSNKNEKENLEIWYNNLEMEMQGKVRQNEKLLIEKDKLNDTLSELKTKISRLEKKNHDFEEAQADVKVLEEKLSESRQECHKTVLNLQKTKQVVKHLQKELESAHNNKEPANNYKEILNSLQNQVEEKTLKVESLKEQIKSLQKHTDFEIKLISSAWFYVQRKLEQSSGFGYNSNMGGMASAGGMNQQGNLKRSQNHSSQQQYTTSSKSNIVTSSWLESQRSVLESQIYPRK
ncbi:hypothetical protein BB558_005624 [Smittium angustum]|uniref:HOOK N-terminal domain-containing protein n=1 Tax=Smittium angustum TaxID=133377 RepID=A0A2U1IVP9_SMIAN|nr:hypothetical protein BB558_007192 [Smittium angustum]PVZ98360.1 hypothetical protein BB558_005624 [Smittium angustum]